MHFTPAQWGEMRPCDFWVAYKAQQERDDAVIAYWSNIARVAVFRIIGPWLKQPPRTVEKFWPMPWDGKGDERIPTGEARKEQIKRLMDQVNGTQS